MRAFGQEKNEIDIYSNMVNEVQKYGHKEAIARSIFFGLVSLFNKLNNKFLSVSIPK